MDTFRVDLPQPVGTERTARITEGEGIQEEERRRRKDPEKKGRKRRHIDDDDKDADKEKGGENIGNVLDVEA